MGRERDLGEDVAGAMHRVGSTRYSISLHTYGGKKEYNSVQITKQTKFEPNKLPGLKALVHVQIDKCAAKKYVCRSVLEQYSVTSHGGQSSCGTAAETVGTHTCLIRCVVSRTGAVFGEKVTKFWVLMRHNRILKSSVRRDCTLGWITRI